MVDEEKRGVEREKSPSVQTKEPTTKKTHESTGNPAYREKGPLGTGPIQRLKKKYRGEGRRPQGDVCPTTTRRAGKSKAIVNSKDRRIRLRRPGACGAEREP